jgi:hypothetical protein
MLRHFLTLILLVGAVCSVCGLEVELPPPPGGYTWAVFEETKSAFLKPDGWYVKETKQGSTLGYFITKEDIDQEGRFITGLTVFVMPDIARKQGMSADQYALTFIKTAAESKERKEVVKAPWAREMGPFKAYGVVLLNRDAEQGDFVTHNLMIGNEETGTVYMIIYEGPAASWDAAWKIGEQMLQCFMIESEI